MRPALRSPAAPQSTSPLKPAEPGFMWTKVQRRPLAERISPLVSTQARSAQPDCEDAQRPTYPGSTVTGLLIGAEGVGAEDEIKGWWRLHPASSSKGAKVQFLAGGKTRVVDGPFTEAKELIAGFWIIQVKDLPEALAWARRIPMGEGQEIEVRQVHRLSDFDANLVSEEHRQREQAWRAEHDKPLAN